MKDLKGSNIAVGLAISVALGVALHNIGVGLAIGIAIGIALSQVGRNGGGKGD